MKSYKSRVSVALILCLSLACSGCCALTRSAHVPKTNLQTLQEDFRQTEAQVEAIRDSILELRTAEAFEVDDAFTEYLVNTERMDRLNRRITTHFESMRTEGIDYFREWDRQAGSYTDPKIRMLTPEQVTDLSDQYVAITEEGDRARRAYTPFAFDVRAIRDSAPPSATKLAYLNFLMEKTEVDANSLDEALQRMLDRIEGVQARMAQIVVPAPTPPRYRMEAPPQKRMETPAQNRMELPQRNRMQTAPGGTLPEPGYRRMEQR